MEGRNVTFSIEQDRYARETRTYCVRMSIAVDNGSNGFSLPFMSKKELEKLHATVGEYLKTIKNQEL